MEKIEIIYKMLINKITLTNNTLQIYGFSQEEIELLISKKVIEAMTDGSYKIYKVDKFRKYGVHLLKKGHYNDANICFKLCYQLAPTGKLICLQVMLAAICRHDYSQIFEIYSNLEKSHPEKNALDNILYLYLLSIITKVPEEFQERTRGINPQDLILPYTIGTKVENEIRKAISQHKFAYACQLINGREEKEKNYSVKFELLKALCNEAANKSKHIKSKISHLIETEDYEQIISMLLKEQKQRRLSELETNTLLLSDAIVKISKTKVIPKKQIDLTYNIQEAILGNNFQLALEINEEYLEFSNIKKENNSINILLTRINNIILSLQEKETKEVEEKEREQEEKDNAVRRIKLLTEIEELADFISSQNMSIDLAIKKNGLFHEQALLVKLIYARDYYKASDYESGDKYLKEVEQDNSKTPPVITLLEEVKALREEYLNQRKTYARRLVQNS